MEEKTVEEESSLQERLKRVEYDTLSGDTCLAEVKSIDEVGRMLDHIPSRIKVTVTLPSGREHSERFEDPETASDEYEFVRLLNSMGYGLSAVDHAEGSDVRVRITDDGPEIIVPEQREDIMVRLVSLIPDSTLMTIYVFALCTIFPLTGVHILKQLSDDLFTGGEETFAGAMFYVVGLLLWMFVVGMVLL